jgi:hypothetical protein
MANIQDAVTEDKLTVAYNPNLLVTYKAIAGTHAAPESPTFLTGKVTEIEWDLHRAREDKDSYRKLQNLVYGLEEQIVEWSDPNYSKDEVLQSLCEYFGINPVKEIQFEGTISFSGTVSVPFNEIEDFDIETYLTDCLSVDSNDGNVEISDWSLDNVNDGS